MATSKQPRLALSLQKTSLYLLVAALVGMLGFLSLKFNTQWDWSAGDRNSLSSASALVLSKLQAPLSITSFAPEQRALRLRIRSVIAPYLRAHSGVKFTFINPSAQPALARKLGIRASGELRIEYQDKGENLQTLDEEHITQAIQRLLLREQRWVVGLEGHGERSLLGQSNYDLGLFGNALTKAGYPLSTLKLTDTPDIPSNTRILVLAGPQSQYLPGEVEQIQQYLKAGGNMLWLADPGKQHGFQQGLQTIASILNIHPLPGTVVDVSGAKLGLDSPAIIPINHYKGHPATRDLSQLSLFPHAMAMEASKSKWQSTAVLQTHKKSWNETSPITGKLALNPELWETPGPLTIGLSLTQQFTDHEQRIVVVGDGDFLSNTFLGNGGNLNLGLNLIRWLAEDDQLLDIPTNVVPDRQINLSNTASAWIGFSFLFALPLLLSGTGFYLGWRRRNRH